MNRAGAETVVMNLMRTIDREAVHFDFLVHTQAHCDYDDEIQSLGGSIYRVPHFNIVNAATYRRACRQLFEEHPEIQVVHGHIGSSSALYLDEASKAGCATVVHSHRDSPKPTSLKAIARRKAYSALIRSTPKVADEFLACSQQAGIDRFGAEIVSGEHFHIMRNAIDLARYACDDESHKSAKERLGFQGIPLVGNVARLSPEKNHSFLLNVFARALPYVPQAKLLLVGRGPLESALKEMAVQLDIADSVCFLGVRDDVPEILKALDVFVFPSFMEGLPLVTVEAQAAGVPSIVSNAIPDEAIVTNVVERLSLEEGIDEWAALLVALLEARLTRTCTTPNVRANGFDINDVASWMARFYKELAQNCERGRNGSLS